MRSLLKEIESKFIELDETMDAVGQEDGDIDNDGDHDKSDDYLHNRRKVRKRAILQDDEELEEQNVTGAIAGYNTPAAFRKTVKRVGYASGVEESINKPPNWTLGSYQKPEDEEEEYTDKFPFAENDGIWQHKNYEYPSKDLTNSPGISKRKDKTQKNKLASVAETMDAKYEKLIESYRSYATGDAKTTPEQKIKHTIKEVARKLQEIEQTINYASRLKTESGVARNGYGSTVDSALTKISERLIKISERVRALGE